MGQGVTTIIIEARALVREALVSLMASNSFQLVGSFASTADVEKTRLVGAAPKLVILGALPAGEASEAAGCIRNLWPETKIILLFDHASLADFQRLLVSEIDGCIPLLASPSTLLGSIEQVIAADLRILVLNTETPSAPRPTTGQKKDGQTGATSTGPTKNAGAEKESSDCTNSVRVLHRLSQREEEVLKSVLRGYSNKMIARACGVTDATIKVHMKSILRKIHVANRTQAAIWALEQGYGVDASSSSPESRPEDGLAAA